MAVKRYKVSNRLLIIGRDAPDDLDLRNVDIVLASDYDALAAQLAEAERMENQAHERVKTLEVELADCRRQLAMGSTP